MDMASKLFTFTFTFTTSIATNSAPYSRGVGDRVDDRAHILVYRYLGLLNDVVKGYQSWGQELA